MIVPAGFNTRSADDLNVTLVTDMNATAGHTVRNAVQTSLVRLMGAAKIAEIGIDQLAQARPFATDAARQQALIDATTRAVTAWNDSPLTVTVEKATRAERNTQDCRGVSRNRRRA